MDFNFVWLVIGLFAVIVYLGIMKRQGRLTETRFALIVTAYWSYFSLNAIHFFSNALSSRNILLFGIALLIVWWTLGYQFVRWVYRQMFLPK